MSSSELANWDGSQSAKEQRQQQPVNRIVQPRAGTANTSEHVHGQREERFDASLRTIEVNGHANTNREETGLVKISQESTIRNTPKPAPDISRIFDEVKVEIVDFNGRWREDNTRTLSIEDTDDALFDGGDAMIVDQMLQAPPSSPPKPALNGFETHLAPVAQSSPSSSSDVQFVSPPPHQIMESLFTPDPTPPPTLERVRFSHIAVPPFPRGLDATDYRRLLRKRPRPLPVAKTRPSHLNRHVETHFSLGDALQSAWNNNGAIHTVSRQRSRVENNPVAGSSLEAALQSAMNNNGPIHTIARQSIQVRSTNLATSSSSASSSYISASAPVKSKPRREQAEMDEYVRQQKKAKLGQNSVSHASSSRYTSVRVSRTPLPAPHPPPQSESDTDTVPVRPRPRKVAHTRYNPMKDIVRLFINGIPPDPHVEVMELNTRFLQRLARPSSQKENDAYEEEREGSERRPTQNPTCRDGPPRPFWREWSEQERWKSNSDSVLRLEGDMTMGGFLNDWKEDSEGADDEEDEDEDDDDSDIVFLGRTGLKDAQAERQSNKHPSQAKEGPSHIEKAFSQAKNGSSQIRKGPSQAKAPPRKGSTVEARKLRIRADEPLEPSSSSIPSIPPQPSKPKPKPGPQGEGTASFTSIQHEKKRPSKDVEREAYRHLSDKALGKRRATSPEVENYQRPRPPPPSLSSPFYPVPPKTGERNGRAPQPRPRAPLASPATFSLLNPSFSIPAKPGAKPAPALHPNHTARAPAASPRRLAPAPNPTPSQPPIRPVPRLAGAGAAPDPTSAASHSSPSQVATSRTSDASAQRPANPNTAHAIHNTTVIVNRSAHVQHPSPSFQSPLPVMISHTLPTHAMTPAQPTHLSPHRPPYHPHFVTPQTSPPDRRQASVSLRQAMDDTQSSLYEPPERSPPSARSVNNPAHPTHAHPPRLPSVTNTNPFVHRPTNTHAAQVPARSRDFLAPSPRSEPSAYFPHAQPSTTSGPFLAVYQEDPESPTKLYRYSSSSVGQGNGPPDEYRYGVSGVLLNEERRGIPEMWMDDNTSAVDHVPGFGNGTIDPSLLGGGQAAEEEHTLVQPLVEYDSSSPTPPPSPPAATWRVNPLVAYESRSPSRSPSPLPPRSFSRSPASHHSRSRSSSPPLSPTRSVRESTAQSRPATSNDSVRDASSLPSWTQPLPRRSRQPRRAPDGMVATGDLDVSSSDESWSDQENRRQKKKSRRLSMSLDPIPLSGPAPRADGASTSTSDHQMGQPARTMAQRPGAKGIRYPQVAEFEYCHQCRSQTNILKFVCPCEKRYCYRCLHTRYTGEQAYNLTLLSFTCPLCKNMCNCTICCKKRGEVYVGSRSRAEPVKRPALQKPSKEASNPVQTVLPRRAGKTNVSDAVPVTTYWATMYGLNGQRIGNAFVGDDGNEDRVVMRALGEPAPETRKRERIFVGDVQEAWGFGDRCLLKEVDPVSWRDRNNGPNERVYVGKKALLYMPTVSRRRRAGVAVPTTGYSQWTSYAGEDFSSPLSSIDGESDAGEGESRLGFEPSVIEADLEMVAQEGLDSFLAKGPGKAFSADSLVDTDVARAISLGLLACGVAVQLSAC